MIADNFPYFWETLMVGLVRIELTTSSLSVTRSNRLSYSPAGEPLYPRVSAFSTAGVSHSFDDIDWLAVPSNVPSSLHRYAVP
jgi:hypothetical protein